MKMKKVLRLALALGLSCNSLSLNAEVSSDISKYTKDIFWEVNGSALHDVYNRMEVYEQGDELKFCYRFDLLKENKKERNDCQWSKKVLDPECVKDILSSVVRVGIDHMLKGYDIVLPSLNRGLALVIMNPKKRTIVKNWKKDGTYNSKIDKIVEPFVDIFIEKFQKQLL